MPDSILFIPSGPGARRWREICAGYCARKKYRIVAIVSVWSDVVTMTRSGRAGVVVVGDRRHLPRDRVPRIEVVTEEVVEPVLPAQRRLVRRKNPAEDR
jgi:hypothetical protein